MNFFYDEWDFVTAYRPGQSVSILFPHNEHWSTIPILIWKLLFAMFGLRNHVPYEAVALGGHVACVLLLFALIRRRSGDLPAFGAAMVLLVLGSGSTDIIWAFQVTWTLSIAFGLLAMLLVDSSPVTLSGWRIVGISAALIGSLMSSGIGLGFLAAVTIELLVDQRRRPHLLAVVVPTVGYLAWFVAYGAGIPGTPGAPCPTCPTAFGNDIRVLSPSFAAIVFAFVALAVQASAAGVVGLAGIAGQLVADALVVLLVWHWLRERYVASWELGLVAGLVVQFTLIGLTRFRFGLLHASDAHYVYVGVVYFLPLVANAIKNVPWRGLPRAAVASSFAVAILTNGVLLADRAVGRVDTMRTENAELQTVESFRGAPDMARNRPLDSWLMPQLTASTYYVAIDVLGSPVPSSTPRSLSALPPDAVDREMIALFSDALQVTAADQALVGTIACQKITSPTGSIVDLEATGGRPILMSASGGGQIKLSLGFMQAPLDWLFSREVQIPSTTWMQLHLPDTGRPILWRVQIVIPIAGDFQVCGAESVHALQIKT